MTASASPPADGLAGRLRRTELQRAASSILGREIVQVLTEIPEGLEGGWHLHPGEEVGFLIPPRTPHNARDVGPGTGQMLSTYLVEVGEPLSTLVPSAAATVEGPPAP